MCIAAKSLSRTHATLLVDGETHFIQDLGSRNKTYRGKVSNWYNNKDGHFEGSRLCRFRQANLLIPLLGLFDKIFISGPPPLASDDRRLLQMTDGEGSVSEGDRILGCGLASFPDLPVGCSMQNILLAFEARNEASSSLGVRLAVAWEQD